MIDHVLIQIFIIISHVIGIFAVLVFLYWLLVCKLIKGITSQNDEPEDY